MSGISSCGINGILKVNKQDRVYTSTSSKGNQLKWRLFNGLWLKSDEFGYEGLAEVVSSYLLSKSNIKDYVNYSMCKILEDEDKTYTGCASNDFLGNDDSLITLMRLFNSFNIDINKETSEKSTEQSLEIIINMVQQLTGLNNFGIWLGKLLEFDAFILNEDRHFNNIAVIRNEETLKYRLMPVFDNGLSFLSDTKEYPMETKLMIAFRNVKSKPFSTDFNKQIRAVHNVVGQQLKFKRKAVSDINMEHITLYSRDIIARVENILKFQAEKYKYLLE